MQHGATGLPTGRTCVVGADGSSRCDADNTGAIVLAGLPAGEYRLLIELATPEHRVITGETVTFTVPAIPAARGEAS